MRFLVNAALLALMASCGPRNNTPSSLELALSQENANVKQFQSEAGRDLRLIIYREDGTVLSKEEAFPKDMASATLCLWQGTGVLEKVRVFKSCCDNAGTEITDLPKLNKDCWQIKPVTCENQRYSMVFTFKDGDVAEYINADYFANQ